jgi:hypothetical protein
VLWKITPLFAEWISSKENNILWSSKILTPESTVAELGCGVSGLVALSLAPSIAHYIATDQEYVQKLFKENLRENINAAAPSTRQSGSSRRRQGRRQRGRKSGGLQASTTGSSRALHAGGGGDEDTDTNNNDQESGNNNITFASLDWETDNPRDLKTLIINRRSSSTAAAAASNSNSHKDDHAREQHSGGRGFDVLIACDCIYNDALIAPLVRTCAELCQLRPAMASGLGDEVPRPQTAGNQDGQDDGLSLIKKPTFCIIAQQLRSPEVFEEWVREALGSFRMWRMSDEVVGEKLGGGSGYVIHLLLLRDNAS